MSTYFPATTEIFTNIKSVLSYFGVVNKDVDVLSTQPIKNTEHVSNFQRVINFYTSGNVEVNKYKYLFNPTIDIQLQSQEFR